jgi:rhamnosyltransferase
MAINKCSENIFIIGVNYTNENILEIYQDINIKESKNIITSGCLYPVSIFDKVGFFNEKLFIDGVDFDFNLRVLLNNFKVYKIQEPMIKHNIGAEISKNILFIKIFSSNHNEIRRYYIGRNHVFLTLKYFYRFPFWIFKKNIFFLLSIFKIIIVEDQILLKLKSLFKGLNDGYQFYVENKSGNK